jgi:hypothetical protein
MPGGVTLLCSAHVLMLCSFGRRSVADVRVAHTSPPAQGGQRIGVQGHK